MSEAGAEREKERDRETQNPGTRLRAVSTEPNDVLELMYCEIFDPSRNQTLNQLSHPGTSVFILKTRLSDISMATLAFFLSPLV